MAVLILLLAMLAFLVWACAHTHRRINWYQDEVDAEAFLSALAAFVETTLSAADATEALIATFRAQAVMSPAAAAAHFGATVDANGLEWVDITPFVATRTFHTGPDYS